MLIRLISGDRPNSLILAVILVGILICLALAPFLFPGTRSLETAARICIFIVLVASFNLLLGYTGIVSFAHTMFFGIGAYAVAISLVNLGRGWDSILIGCVLGTVLSIVLAIVISLFSLRVKAIFFAMVTLAVASAFAVLVSQFSSFTGGEDGLNYRIPRMLTPAFKFSDEKILGVSMNGKLLKYYFVFFAGLILFLILLRIVNSPFGSVLKAIRENAYRAEAIGYRVIVYRTTANALSAAIASLSGALLAIWLGYTGPATTLSLEIMVDILLMSVIGGMGSMYGAVLGATLFVLAQNYLQNLMGIAAETTAMIPLLSNVLSPDRWLLWLGVLFILSVYFFPKGIVGRLQKDR